MADNASVVSEATTEKFKIAADEATYSGDTAKVQLFRQVHVSGAEGSKSIGDVVGAVGSPAAFATTTQEAKATTATLANVSGSASSVTLLASNAARLKAIIANDSTAILYVKFGSSATSTSWTFKLQADESVPIDTYTGIITGIWASATGAARVTELTA